MVEKKQRKIDRLRRRLVRLAEQKKAQEGRSVTSDQLVAYLSALVDVGNEIRKIYR